MVKICSHTIVKNGEDFIIPCLRQILPYVDKAIVSIANNSTDNTFQLVSKLAEENNKINIQRYAIKNPFISLVEERNRQISLTKEDWIWVVDDDEYYLDSEIKDILSKLSDGYDAYSLKFWYVVDKENYNPFKGKRTIRFFKNKNSIKWKGQFGEEKIDVQSNLKLGNSYVHLSYLKKDSWRNDFAPKRFLRSEYNTKSKLPNNIIRELKPLWSKQETF